MDIDSFTQGYKAAREQRDDRLFTALFTPDAEYANTVLKATFGGSLCTRCQLWWHSMPRPA